MYKNIKKYLFQENYPFHMPGHKGNFFAFDITEIPKMDILSAPSGIIKNFQNKIAKKFFAEKSFFLVNGSSAGIVAAICACANEDTTVYVPRNAHVSLFNGLVFSGAKPVYFLPEITDDGLYGGVSPEIFNDITHGAVVFIVSPTYEGFVSDIAAIAKNVHARGGVLIVDEAHGAHFSFHDCFPKTAMQQGADIAVNSLHKTLPVISGCAVLHAQGNRINFSRLQFFINAMQTTSPSYLMMANCDFVLHKLWNNPCLFEEYVSRLINLREELPCFTDSAALRLSGSERIGNNAIVDVDDGKLLFIESSVHTAEKISEIFSNEYKLQLEMAKGKHLLAITSVADTQEGFSQLEKAVNGFNKTFNKIIKESVSLPIILPEQVLSPRDAMQRESEEVPSSEAIGRISAEIITEYPPGIATVIPGERINTLLAKKIVRVVKWSFHQRRG
ncbi:MAG: aminotransferase class I/II-fold pyridoxal phosphate-dependent enzyme [Clostridiales bacterium]|jgi:arginine/lysine/ornithine decarboxylase|nr:aminotransferase class I/II-fold pyridoxal phosphate-dependent enzyme [Clostridiales bacterium]